MTNMAKIIHLDDYLREYLEKNRYNLVNTVADILGISPEEAKDLYKSLDHRRELDLVNVLDNPSLSDLEKKAVVRGIFTNELASRTHEDVFNGVDVAEGYNYRNLINNEVARSRIMDWLEEGGYDFLIDNAGNFAVKCPDRKTHYRVSRQFEHFKNKRMQSPVQKSVDPDTIRKGLSDRPSGNYLRDTTEDFSGASSPIEQGNIKSPFSSPSNDMTDEFRYEDSESGALAALGDLMSPTSNVSVKADPTRKNQWLVVNNDTKQAFIVHTDSGDHEEVDYNQAASGVEEHVAGKLAWARKPSSEYDPATSWLGRKHAAGEYYDEPALDPKTGQKVSMASQERRVNAFARIPTKELLAVADQGFAAKAKLLKQYVPDMPNERIIDAVKALNNEIKQRKADHEKEWGESVSEAKRTAKSRERTAKEKLANLGQPEKGAAGRMAQKHSQGQGKSAGPMKSKKSYTRTKKVDTDESYEEITENLILGVAGMPTLGSINRIRQLAGMPVGEEITTTIIKPEIPNETPSPVQPNVSQMCEAMKHLKEIFNIYRALDEQEQSELRKTLVDTIVSDGYRVNEGVVDYFASDNTLLLEELKLIKLNKQNIRNCKILMESDSKKPELKEVLTPILRILENI